MPYKDPEKAREWAKEYSKQPEVKERKKEWSKAYQKRPEVKDRL